jgi:hypothetical protein
MNPNPSSRLELEEVRRAQNVFEDAGASTRARSSCGWRRCARRAPGVTIAPARFARCSGSTARRRPRMGAGGPNTLYTPIGAQALITRSGADQGPKPPRHRSPRPPRWIPRRLRHRLHKRAELIWQDRRRDPETPAHSWPQRRGRRQRREVHEAWSNQRKGGLGHGPAW